MLRRRLMEKHFFPLIARCLATLFGLLALAGPATAQAPALFPEARLPVPGAATLEGAPTPFPTAADRTPRPDGDARSATPGGGALAEEYRVLGKAFVHSFTSPAEWDEQEWQAVPSWIAGVVGISLLDEWAREGVYRPVSPQVDAALDLVEPLGAEGSFAVLGGFYAAGLLLDDRRARSVALEGLAASALAGGIITPVVQRVAGRKRPRHSTGTHEFEPFSGHVGFPSGHVTQAFAVASVIATEYDAWWVDGLAYGAATGVAMHRMVNGAHHLSDVAAGALIGTVVGRCIARFGQQQRGERVLLRPFGGPGLDDGTQMGVSVSF